MSKIKLGKIQININEDVKVELTVNQVKELRDVLLELFPKTPPAPVVIEKTVYPYRRVWDYWNLNFPQYPKYPGWSVEGDTFASSGSSNADLEVGGVSNENFSITLKDSS